MLVNTVLGCVHFAYDAHVGEVWALPEGVVFLHRSEHVSVELVLVFLFLVFGFVDLGDEAGGAIHFIGSVFFVFGRLLFVGFCYVFGKLGGLLMVELIG